MVRTRDSGSRKAVGSKAPRKALASTTSSTPSPSGKRGGSKSSGGFNRAMARPTPEWQKGIQGFLKPGTSSTITSEEASRIEGEEENMDPQVAEENNEEEVEAESSPAAAASSSSSSAAEPSSSASSITKNGLISDDDDDE